ncbi:collagen-like triple helix repeat-containing protein [Bordetella avium]|uniref:collagen-like triple helix repeat-containing protein n=1 Tax=Bordetella avium TaxID=521 RepID=UPI0006740B80|nr:collagen-like triple helix repeat-containing protein [Bordetella avium]RIQ51929.1 hypothetical protein D0843_08515 [Bordetella avium]RIQ69054.1 hypothetical protein D0838_14580 [Bordetella avium]
MMQAQTDTLRGTARFRLSLISVVAALSACGGGRSASAGAIGGSDGAGKPSTNPPVTTPVTTGLLQTTLGGTSQAVDNALPLNASAALGGLGKALDPATQPIVNTVENLTQTVGSNTGLGAPVAGLLNSSGSAVKQLGDNIAKTRRTRSLGDGVGGLARGLGDTLSSASGLPLADPGNPAPLTAVAKNAPAAVGALTPPLGSGPLRPLAEAVGELQNALLPKAKIPLLEPALNNTGRAVDKLMPLGQQAALSAAGAGLDPTVAPIVTALSDVTQKAGDASPLGASISGLLNNVGADAGTTNQAGLDSALQGIGRAVSDSGGGLHAPPTTAPLWAPSSKTSRAPWPRWTAERRTAAACSLPSRLHCEVAQTQTTADCRVAVYSAACRPAALAPARGRQTATTPDCSAA